MIISSIHLISKIIDHQAQNQNRPKPVLSSIYCMRGLSLQEIKRLLDKLLNSLSLFDGIFVFFIIKLILSIIQSSLCISEKILGLILVRTIRIIDFIFGIINRILGSLNGYFSCLFSVLLNLVLGILGDVLSLFSVLYSTLIITILKLLPSIF